MDSPLKEDGHKRQNEIKKTKGKLAIKTGNKDYGGNLGLPEKIVQREFETTGQFFRRLDRLVAKAKVEANLDSRFDTRRGKLSNDKQSDTDLRLKPGRTIKSEPKKKHKKKRKVANNALDGQSYNKKRARRRR